MRKYFLPIVQNLPIIFKRRIILAIAIGHGFSGIGTGTGVLSPVLNQDTGYEMPV
jgi:hypothetical protein